MERKSRSQKSTMISVSRKSKEINCSKTDFLFNELLQNLENIFLLLKKFIISMIYLEF
jgi:hypothetical protein